MPYKITKSKKGKGYDVKTLSTGKTVHAKSKKSLKGVLWHKEHGK